MTDKRREESDVMDGVTAEWLRNNSPTQGGVEALAKALPSSFGGVELTPTQRLRTAERLACVYIAEDPEVEVPWLCPVCGGPLEPGDEGPECDPTGCPARSEGVERA